MYLLKYLGLRTFLNVMKRKQFAVTWPMYGQKQNTGGRAMLRSSQLSAYIPRSTPANKIIFSQSFVKYLDPVNVIF